MEQASVAELCIAITEAEYAGRVDEARALAAKAWHTAGDDYEACLAAHYVARYETEAESRLRWNQLALQHAEAAGPERAGSLLPSLYVNLGSAHEALGNATEAADYYRRAAELGLTHQSNSDDPSRAKPQ